MAINVAEVKKRLTALLNDPNLVTEYIRQFGPTIDIKHLKAIKEGRGKYTGESDPAKGDDPVFEVMVRCPVCNRDEITCYELRAKSQQMLMNKFLVSNYTGAGVYRTMDYALLSVTVCPRCLFASPDKKDFIRQPTTGSADSSKSQLTTNVLMTLQEKIGERKAIVKTATDYETFFKRPRNSDTAVISYRLAMSRANVEAWYEQPYSLYKLGAYCLRIAKLIKDKGGDNREALREALGYFEEAFRSSNCPSEEIEIQVIYTLVALFLKTGDQKKANSYISVFSNLRSTRLTEMRTNTALNTTIIDKWEERAKRLWEDRDEGDLFKDE